MKRASLQQQGAVWDTKAACAVAGVVSFTFLTGHLAVWRRARSPLTLPHLFPSRSLQGRVDQSGMVTHTRASQLPPWPVQQESKLFLRPKAFLEARGGITSNTVTVLTPGMLHSWPPGPLFSPNAAPWLFTEMSLCLLSVVKFLGLYLSLREGRGQTAHGLRCTCAGCAQFPTALHHRSLRSHLVPPSQKTEIPFSTFQPNSSESVVRDWFVPSHTFCKSQKGGATVSGFCSPK